MGDANTYPHDDSLYYCAPVFGELTEYECEELRWRIVQKQEYREQQHLDEAAEVDRFDAYLRFHRWLADHGKYDSDIVPDVGDGRTEADLTTNHGGTEQPAA